MWNYKLTLKFRTKIKSNLSAMILHQNKNQRRLALKSDRCTYRKSSKILQHAPQSILSLKFICRSRFRGAFLIKSSVFTRNRGMLSIVLLSNATNELNATKTTTETRKPKQQNTLSRVFLCCVIAMTDTD